MASTETSTPTTPATPITTTSDVPRRWGMDRRLTSVIWATWLSPDISAVPRQGVHDPEALRPQRRRQPDGESDADRELLLRLGLGLVGRVQEAPVDLGGDGPGLAGIGDPLDVPAGGALAGLARLVEERDVDEHHVGVAADRRVLGVEHAHELEL